MRLFIRAVSALASVIALSLLTVAPAAAECKQFGFLVNDYGKEGPTKDAKRLLDKHIEKWALENDIVEYRVGKKTVTCELFLDFIVFDEHTCTAKANVCWGRDAKKKKKRARSAAAKTKAKKKAAVKNVETSTSKTTKAVELPTPTGASDKGKENKTVVRKVNATPKKPVGETAAPAVINANAVAPSAPNDTQSSTPRRPSAAEIAAEAAVAAALKAEAAASRARAAADKAVRAVELERQRLKPTQTATDKPESPTSTAEAGAQ